MKKNDKYVDENLIYILENTTPYQRLLWLKKAIEFWKMFKSKRNLFPSRTKHLAAHK